MAAQKTLCPKCGLPYLSSVEREGQTIYVHQRPTPPGRRLVGVRFIPGLPLQPVFQTVFSYLPGKACTVPTMPLARGSARLYFNE